MFNSAVKSFHDNYVAEIMVVACIIYLLASFVYLSFDFTSWPIGARTVVALSVLAFMVFSQYVAAHRGGR